MLAKTVLLGAVQKRAGVMAAGPVTTALLTSGASLMLTRGRRPIGLALAVLGGALMWREAEREREAAQALLTPSPTPADGDAAVATTPR